MDHRRENVVGVFLAGDRGQHADEPGDWRHFQLYRRCPGQCNDGEDDGHGVFHAAQPASEHLGVSGGTDQAV